MSTKVQGIVLLLLVCCAAAFSFTGDDKFIKKYAMMKVYESCFGPDVIKEVRKEMRIATSKCTGLSTAPLKIQHFDPPQHQTPTLTKTQGQNSQVHNIQIHGSKPTPTPLADTSSASPGFDLNKLQQVIMSGYNKHAQQTSYQQSQPQPQPPPQNQFSHNTHPYLHGGLTNSVYQPPQQYNPFYPPPQSYYPPPSPYYPHPPPLYPHYYRGQRTSNHGGLTNSVYQPPQQYNPFYPPPQSYYPPPSPYYPHPPPLYPHYYRGQRTSRDFDIRGQLDSLAAKMTGKVRNVTCVMQELGYLDDNLEPAYNKMIDRISRLPIPDDLKRDMTDGVDFCRQFAQCVPDERKDKLAREMVRPIFFFRCYKHKKLEACIMKDVRDKYNPTEDMGEDNLPGGEMRSLKNKKRKNLDEDDAIAAAALEFLDAEKSFDLDAII